MSETTASLRRKISGAGDLQSVVRTMKAVAASSIGQYEKSVRSLADYYHTVELGLGACLTARGQAPLIKERKRQTDADVIGAVVFGSDQGLVGQFNDVVADYAVKTLAALPAKSRVWAVGERVHARLADAGLQLAGLYTVPNSVKAITPLVGQILVESEPHHSQREVAELHLFYNRPTSGPDYAPVGQRLLPLDENWRRKLAELPWPTGNLPEVMGGGNATLRRSSANISSFRCFGRAPNPWPAKMRAAWRRCNAPTKTSTNCWRTSTGHTIACARAASTRSSSTSSQALSHWSVRGSNQDEDESPTQTYQESRATYQPLPARVFTAHLDPG